MMPNKVHFISKVQSALRRGYQVPCFTDGQIEKQQLPGAELQRTGIFLGTSLYSSYHPLPKQNTDTGEVP